MINIVKDTIKFYTKYFKVPTINDIKFYDTSLLEKQGSVFVTIYKNGEVRGSAGNIKEIRSSLALELIENTIAAISKDNRFSALKADEVDNLKVRIDLIVNRKVLKDKEISKIDPVKYGILAIKKDYENMAVILPNIDPKLLSGEDFIPMLEAKFGIQKFDENEYIVYSIETEVVRD